MEDDLHFLGNGRQPNLFGNGRRPQFLWKWKTTSIFLEMEDDLNLVEIEGDHKF